MQEMWVGSLGWEDPPEEEMATHSSILAWKIPWTEEPGGLQSMGSQRVRHSLVTEQQQLQLMNDKYYQIATWQILILKIEKVMQWNSARVWDRQMVTVS